jgi:branched-chain amino acid transport system ATP-binding protein
MANPSLLLLDEPSEGLAPLVVAHIVEVLGRVKREGVTILLADQNLRFCRKVCDRGYVLEKGRIAFEGTMEEICGDDRILRKYLAI